MGSKWLPRAAGLLLLCVALSGTASAQYGGGGSGGAASSGSGTSGSGGYGSGKVATIGIGVGAAAAVVGIALYVHQRHNAARSQTSVVSGCTQSEIDGIGLKNENDQQIYMIISSGAPLQVGQRVELTGVVTDQGPGARTFRVQGPITSYGSCRTNVAALTQTTMAQTH